MFPCVWPCPEPDPEELCTFTDLYGSLRLLLSFQVLVYSPSNVPVTGPSTFIQNLPACLDCQQLGLRGLRCSAFKDLVLSGATVYEVEQENWEEESSLPTIQQRLLLLLFLQHSDPFSSHLSDVMATEAMIEHHLEDILSNNRQAVTAALQTELRNTLIAQNHRKKNQEKLCSAVEVILSSSISVVSCSSNVDFRNACLTSMKVRDTHELLASICESLRRVTSWKFTPRSRCYSAQMEEHPDGPTRAEI
ncbi:type 2 DNA topoisomerase 6 subunit B-like protein [Lates japonicus]|uniref:Type 2 DNA topoisomerase 6 subunit B-like protein n=1 Tax=Lates japonicus TaxID=270547 RepID=A0AAD3N9D9_LATJO|nr:type 2 DNA topoisomerase 6 subunit B-like protein [Lates japonicus]